MESFSDAHYSLALDIPAPQEPNQVAEEPPGVQQSHSKNQNLLLLYQRDDPAINEEDKSDPQFTELIDGEKANIEVFEVDMNSYRFQWKMFLISFLLHFLYLTGIGLFILALFWCWWPKFIRNHFRYTDQANLVHFTIGGLVFILMVTKGQDYMDLKFNFIYHCQMMLICSFACAAVESYCHDKFMNFLRNVELTRESFEISRFRLDTFYKVSSRNILKKTTWNQLKQSLIKVKATEEEIKKEREKLEKLWHEERKSRIECAIRNSISKLNIDISFYYLTFFEKTPQNLLRVIADKMKLGVESYQNQIICFSKQPKSELLAAITYFEEDLFLHKYFTEPNKYDEEKAHAYILASNLLLRIDKSDRNFGWTKIFFCFAFSYVACICSFNGNKKTQWWWYFLVPFSTQASYYCLLYFIYKAVDLMKSKYTYMKELEQLMFTTRKCDGGEKSYPIINFLDFMSLKSWTCLRKIFMHLNNEKLRGTILAVSIILVIELLTVVVVALYHFHILKSPDDYKTLFFVFVLNALLYLTALSLLIYYAAKVNAQFLVHKNQIRSIKQTVTMLFKFYPDFVGQNAIKPGTYIYQEGLKFLKKEFGENLSIQTIEKMKEKEKTLMEYYDSILEELDYEETNHPIKILGLPITMTVVKSFAAMLISIATPLIKQGILSLSDLAQDPKTS